MSPTSIRQLLKDHAAVDDEDREPVFLSPSDLDGLTAEDVPEGVQIQVGTLKDKVHHIEFEGWLQRGDKTPLEAYVDLSWYRKYWDAPLGMPQYLDLVRRALETRQRQRGDVELENHDDDGAWIHLGYRILLSDSDLASAFKTAARIEEEMQEAANAVCRDIDQRIATAARNLSGWGSLPIEKLIDEVENQATSDAKGRVLEELSCKLFESVPGFVVNGRYRTETEEIDIRLENGSDDPVWKREEALILAECKNWSSKCGKNEFVIFKAKLENRNQRCSCGVLISWNGFTETVTKEMLRGSTGRLLIIPIEGIHVRQAVREKSFPKILKQRWEECALL